MSKIAEKKAKELGYSTDPLNRDEYTANDVFYAAVECYDEAIQDFLEKAEMYLKTRVYYNMHPNNVTTAIQEFKNYMQDESEN